MRRDRRRFNRGERVALYLAADGRCAACAALLDRGWHADHVVPYGVGGKTDVLNGQALCPGCNRKKGGSVTENGFRLREFQRATVEAALDGAARKKPIIVHAEPGSGKTAAFILAANALWRAGYINALQWFTARLNLCRQAEQDSKELLPLLRSSPAERVIEPIAHRENEPPLIRKGRFGYVTTYNSGTAAPELHLAVANRYKVLLVCDEAQQLGVDEERGGTRGADMIKWLAQHAAVILIGTGTPDRSDGRRLLFCEDRYRGPDAEGWYQLEPDVFAGYIDGVSAGYLRPFEYQLTDGSAIREYLDGERESVTLSRGDGPLRDVLEHPDFWRDAVDRFVAAVRNKQTIHPRFCGLIAAYNQAQAKKIIRYIKDKFPGFSTLLAVSDERAALDNLRQFRRGGIDALVTVRMAHVGYDHKAIIVVCALTDFRAFGFLDQLMARATRVWKEVRLEHQTMLAIVPDDPKMAEYVEEKRSASERGIKEREGRITCGPPLPPREPKLSQVIEARALGTRAQGLSPDGDLSTDELASINALMSEFPIGAANPTGLGELLRSKGVALTPSSSAILGTGVASAVASAVESGGATVEARLRETQEVHRPTDLTDAEWERQARNQLHQLLKRQDARLMNAGQIGEDQWGYSGKQCHVAFNRRPVSTCSVDEILERIRWVEADYTPRVDRWVGG